MAGFSEVHLTKEPNAAAYFYGFKHLRLDGYKMLVLDFGGGTLDVSILKVENGEFEVLATCGRKWLGGRDLDELVRTETVKRIKTQFDFDCTKCRKGHNTEYKIDCEGCRRVKRNMQVLLEECERMKIDLSTRQDSSIDLYKIGIEAEVPLTRKEYEDLGKIS